MLSSLLCLSAWITLAEPPATTEQPVTAGVQIKGSVSKYDPDTHVVTVKTSDGKEHEIRLNERTRLVDPTRPTVGGRRPVRTGERRPVLGRLRELLREGAGVSVTVDKEGPEGTATEVRLNGPDRGR